MGAGALVRRAFGLEVRADDGLEDVIMHHDVVFDERLESMCNWTDRSKLPIILLRETENRLKLQDGHHRLTIARKRGDGCILAIVVDEC